MPCRSGSTWWVFLGGLYTGRPTIQVVCKQPCYPWDTGPDATAPCCCPGCLTSHLMFYCPPCQCHRLSHRFVLRTAHSPRHHACSCPQESCPCWLLSLLQESSVVPVLMQALQSLCRERPDDPVEYIANYLLQHNPKKNEPAAQRPPQGAPAASDSVAQPAQVGSSKT